MNDLSDFYRQTDKIEKAIRASQRALKIAGELGEKAVAEKGRAQRSLGLISMQLEDYDTAEQYLELSIETYQTIMESSHETVQEVWGHLALCLSKKKRRYY